MTDLHPLMPKATAVWLVDNTTLTFRQIAEFCGLHELEVSGIADGEVATSIKGFDPIQNNQLTIEEIRRCEADPAARLRLLHRNIAPPPKRKGPRYTPVSKRQDRPAAIAWIVRNHPEVETVQIAKLLGSTKPTIEAIRNRTHWNSANIQPVDPVALGLCTQSALDAVVEKAVEKKRAAAAAAGAPGQGLLSTEDSLARAEPEAEDAEDAFVRETQSMFDAAFARDEPAPARSDAEADIDPESVFRKTERHDAE